MSEERRVLVLAIRALLRRDVRDSQGHHDYDTEAVLAGAKLLGVDVETEEQRAIDARTIPASEFDRKWGEMKHPLDVRCSHPLDARITQPADERFEERAGCLLCDTWIQPVRFKGPRR